MEDITEVELQKLIDEEIIEKNVLEYKSELPGNIDSDKKEFLADISSFANGISGESFNMDITYKHFMDINSIFNLDEKYTFLVGAGISMNPPSNIPNANNFVEIMVKICAPKDYSEKLISYKPRFELVVEAIRAKHDEDLQVFDYFEQVAPNIIHFFLANMIVQGKGKHHVI